MTEVQKDKLRAEGCCFLKAILLRDTQMHISTKICSEKDFGNKRKLSAEECIPE